LGGKEGKGDGGILFLSRLTILFNLEGKGRNKREIEYFSSFHWSGTCKTFSFLPFLQTNQPLSLSFPFSPVSYQANDRLTNNSLEHIREG
jgi:hypothetical protein